ncbi:hypothetical protein JCM1841_006155 [Sporobolomyces salmonicolor]
MVATRRRAHSDDRDDLPNFAAEFNALERGYGSLSPRSTTTSVSSRPIQARYSTTPPPPQARSSPSVSPWPFSRSSSASPSSHGKTGAGSVFRSAWGGRGANRMKTIRNLFGRKGGRERERDRNEGTLQRMAEE